MYENTIQSKNFYVIHGAVFTLSIVQRKNIRRYFLLEFLVSIKLFDFYFQQCNVFLLIVCLKYGVRTVREKTDIKIVKSV
jgi:hypothetical protein